MEATEKREAVGLTETEREASVRLIEVFGQLSSDTDRLIALAYIEGMAAASAPKATA